MTEQSENPAPKSSKIPPAPSDASSPDSNSEVVTSEAEDTTAEAPAADPLTEAKGELTRLREQLLRTAADFDNYRKRSRRESTEAEQRGRETFMRDVLPVFDNLERAVAHAEVATDVQSLLNGIQMVVRQFADTLQRLGIERVPTVGTQFDPTVHEAIQHMETDVHAPGVIAAEIQGGYMAQKRLIRPALVVVAKAKPAESPAVKHKSEAPAASEEMPPSEARPRSEASPPNTTDDDPDDARGDTEPPQSAARHVSNTDKPDAN